MTDNQKLSTCQAFLTFLKLGLTSFRGPVAHPGYFRDEFVIRRRCLKEESYADLVALCQFLPGPASSQVGMAIGISQSGLRGGLAAWTGFTLPFREGLRRNLRARQALLGINAAVVGLLLAAFYDPVWSSGILSVGDFVLVIASFCLLTFWQVPPWIIVGMTGLGGAVISLL